MSSNDAEMADADSQIIKPQAYTPALDASNWPLLLKDYHKRKFLNRRVSFKE
jgi:hypothetical protein